MVTVLTLICWILLNFAAVLVVCSPAIAVAYCVYAIIRDKKEAKAKGEWIAKNW